MIVAGVFLLFAILICALYSLTRSNRNLAAWAILLGLVYYHPLVLDPSAYGAARLACALMYLPIAALALLGKGISFTPPAPEASSIPPRIFLAIFLVAIVGIEMQIGFATFWSTKLLSGQLYDAFSSFTIVMYASGTLFAVSCLTKSHRYGVVVAGALVIFFVLLGDRTQPAFIVLYALILYTITSRARFLYVLPPLLGFLLLYGKQIYIYSLTNDLTAFYDFSAASATGLAESIALMDATERALELHVDLPSYLYRFVLYAAPFSLDSQLHFFQDIYKSRIFPEFSDSAGAAGNVLVELYWNYWYLGPLLFGILLCLIIVGIAKLSQRSSDLAMLSLLLFVTLFMYMPRNSIFTIISHEKKFIYTFVLAWAASFALRRLKFSR